MTSYNSPRRTTGSYASLGGHMRYSSMAWWLTKTAQGVLIGGGIAGIGLLMILAYAWLEQGAWLSRFGIILIIAGILVFLRYFGAPFTARWIVRVPEGWTFAVIDGDGYTIEYLPPGRMIVPWRWRATVEPYANFRDVQVQETLRNVLASTALQVDVDVSVALRFEPDRAHESQFDTLRQISKREQITRMVAREIREIVSRHMSDLAPTYTEADLLTDDRPLADTIIDELTSLEDLGLFIDGEQAVWVQIRVPRRISETLQSVQQTDPMARETAETLQAVKQIAQELQVPYEEAVQLYVLLQKGEAVLETPPHGTPVPQTAATATPVGREAAVETAEHDAVSIPPGTESGDTGPRIVRDPDRAPDPIDLRRRRKRRSRRLDE